MSLCKRGSVWHYDFQFKGKRYQGSCETSDKDEAEAFQLRKMMQAGNGRRPYNRTKDAAEPGIYFLYSPSSRLIKVGCSANITERIKSIDNQNPEELQLVGKIPILDYRRAECAIHEFLKVYRVKGEWFRISYAHIEAAVLYWAGKQPLESVEKAIRSYTRKFQPHFEPYETFDALLIGDGDPSPDFDAEVSS